MRRGRDTQQLDLSYAGSSLAFGTARPTSGRSGRSRAGCPDPTARQDSRRGCSACSRVTTGRCWAMRSTTPQSSPLVPASASMSSERRATSSTTAAIYAALTVSCRATGCWCVPTAISAPSVHPAMCHRLGLTWESVGLEPLPLDRVRAHDRLLDGHRFWRAASDRCRPADVYWTDKAAGSVIGASQVMSRQT